MLYITGIHALNLPCTLLTCGDWHTSAISWARVPIWESTGTIFEDYGIEHGKAIPDHDGRYNVANHLRALLDLLVQGNFAVAQGMNKDYICNDDYNLEIFQKVMMLNSLERWPDIDSFMGHEYYGKWLMFKESEYLWKVKEIGQKNTVKLSLPS